MATSGLSNSLSPDIDELSVVIRFNGNQSYIFVVNAESSVKALKSLVGKEASISPGNINLVLAGHLLQDSLTLKECGLGAQTTLHAFCRTKEKDGLILSSTDRNVLLPAGLNNDEVGAVAAATAKGEATSISPRSYNQSHFFVYCKLCKCVRPAKLRVRCKMCNSGAFIVQRGPENWDDISPDTTIRGSCKAQHCKSDVPVGGMCECCRESENTDVVHTDSKGNCLNNFYMRCKESHEGDVEGTAVVLKHVHANRRRVECIICGDIVSHVLIFPCVSGHVICLECFRQYGSSCLSQRRFVEHSVYGYTLPCPAGCTDSYIEENHHFLLMGPEKYERYKNFGAEEFVLQNGGLLCPGPGCGMGLFLEEGQTTVRCQECQLESCRNCQRPSHTGPCEEQLQSHLELSEFTVSDEQSERACWERQSLTLIEVSTKSCPGCGTKTERSGGCMHMVCTRCATEWCWLCVKPWDRNCQADHWFG